MRRVFADATYWIALLHEDQWTEAASEARAQLGAIELVTTEEVLTEVLNFCAKLHFVRSRAAETVRRVVANPAVRVIGQSHEGFMDGLNLTLIQTVLQSTATIEPMDQELRVTLSPLSSPHRSQAVAALCEYLNTAETCFPGTDLRLRFAVAGYPK